MKYLYRILRLFCCPHNWIIQKESPVYTQDIMGKVSEMPLFYTYVLQCKHCGELKSFKAD